MSDLHCGSICGLTPPRYWSEDTRGLQEPFWNWYKDTLKTIGPVDVLVINGDAVDGEGKKESIGHITTDTLKQADIAVECIEMIKVPARAIHAAYGTDFHVLGTYSYEDAVADKLEVTISDSVLLNIRDKRFNFRHACGRSDIPYGQGTQTFKEAILDILRADAGEYEEADITVRAHVHYYCRMEVGRRVALTLPCLQLPFTVFGRRCRHAYYDVGMMLIQVDDAGVNITPYLMPLVTVQKQEYICL